MSYFLKHVAKVTFYSHNWLINYPQVGQLFDAFPNVPWTALELLDEACDDKMNLEAVVCALGKKMFQ